MWLDARLLDECSSDQFTEDKRRQRWTVQNFLGGIRSDRYCALKFQRPTAMVGHEQSTHVSLFRNFDCRQKTQAELVWLGVGCHTSDSSTRWRERLEPAEFGETVIENSGNSVFNGRI